MVMAYVPDARVHFQSDLWFPGVPLPSSPALVQLNDAIKAANLQVEKLVGGHGGIVP
jgi:hypothetical protein